MLNHLLALLAQSSIDIPESELEHLPMTDPSQTTVSTVLELVFGLLGAIAFLIIVIAGIRFSLSRGNPDAVSKARNTIIYAVVGLVVAMLAFAIVRYVGRSLS